MTLQEKESAIKYLKRLNTTNVLRKEIAIHKNIIKHFEDEDKRHYYTASKEYYLEIIKMCEVKIDGFNLVKEQEVV